MVLVLVYDFISQILIKLIFFINILPYSKVGIRQKKFNEMVSQNYKIHDFRSKVLCFIPNDCYAPIIMQKNPKVFAGLIFQKKGFLLSKRVKLRNILIKIYI